MVSLNQLLAEFSFLYTKRSSLDLYIQTSQDLHFSDDCKLLIMANDKAWQNEEQKSALPTIPRWKLATVNGLFRFAMDKIDAEFGWAPTKS